MLAYLTLVGGNILDRVKGTEACSHWLIHEHDIVLVIPWVGVIGLVSICMDSNRTQFQEVAQLTRWSRSSIEPNDCGEVWNICSWVCLSRSIKDKAQTLRFYELTYTLSLWIYVQVSCINSLIEWYLQFWCIHSIATSGHSVPILKVSMNIWMGLLIHIVKITFQEESRVDHHEKCKCHH